MGELKFRVARPEDAEALLAIYAPYVEETAITFEYEVPSVEAFRARIAHTLETYPYIVAVEEQSANADTAHADGVPASSTPAAGADATGGTCRTSEHIIGYAYVGRLHERAAYDWTVETSIYVDRSARKHGLGRQLYERLESILRAMNIISVNACIAYPGTMNATVGGVDHIRYDAGSASGGFCRPRCRHWRRPVPEYEQSGLSCAPRLSARRAFPCLRVQV